MSPIRSEQLSAWEKQLAADVAALRDRQRSLESEIKRNESKLQLLRQMISLDQASEGGAIAPQLGDPAKATSITVKESVKNILEQAKRPLHISEIHREFITRGFPIPGGGTPFNILVHIVKDRGFIRIARGTYSLRTGAEIHSGMPETQKRKVRRKRKKRKTRIQTDQQSQA